MASADITAKDTVVRGVNSPNNYVRSEAHLIDGTENAEILAADTHSLFKLPKGTMLTALKICALPGSCSQRRCRRNRCVPPCWKPKP